MPSDRLDTLAGEWVVVIRKWHFGPLDEYEAVALAKKHGGKEWPLWAVDDVDAMSGLTALEAATQQKEERDGD